MEHYNENNKDQHFYATCAMGWARHVNMFTCLEKLSKAYKREFSKGEFYVAVYHVPLPPNTEYRIKDYIPRRDDGSPIDGMTKLFEGFM